MNTITNPVHQVDQAFYFILSISVFLLFAITIVMVYFVIRYRRSANPEPSDIREHLGLEILWTVIPTIIVIAMFIFGWTSYTGLRDVPEGAIEIDVEAQMFSWLFIYPEDQESENELIVPEGKPIKLNITSLDVLHSFYIPAFRTKVDAVKGMDTYVWFYADKVGEYDILCTEYCGVDHAEMLATLKIVSQAEYLEWLEENE